MSLEVYTRKFRTTLILFFSFLTFKRPYSFSFYPQATAEEISKLSAITVGVELMPKSGGGRKGNPSWRCKRPAPHKILKAKATPGDLMRRVKRDKLPVFLSGRSIETLCSATKTYWIKVHFTMGGRRKKEIAALCCGTAAVVPPLLSHVTRAQCKCCGTGFRAGYINYNIMFMYQEDRDKERVLAKPGNQYIIYFSQKLFRSSGTLNMWIGIMNFP